MPNQVKWSLLFPLVRELQTVLIHKSLQHKQLFRWNMWWRGSEDKSRPAEGLSLQHDTSSKYFTSLYRQLLETFPAKGIIMSAISEFFPLCVNESRRLLFGNTNKELRCSNIFINLDPWTELREARDLKSASTSRCYVSALSLFIHCGRKLCSIQTRKIITLTWI